VSRPIVAVFPLKGFRQVTHDADSFFVLDDGGLSVIKNDEVVAYWAPHTWQHATRSGADPE